MNLNLINLKPTEWSKADWNDSYSDYCKNNIYGAKTKKEYYEMVLNNFARLESNFEPLSIDLMAQWSRGKKAAAEWARKHGCDMNGRLLEISSASAKSREAIEVADSAEEIAIDTMQRLDYIIDKIREKKNC